VGRQLGIASAGCMGLAGKCGWTGGDTQFTISSKPAVRCLRSVSVELTYGLERIGMFRQGVRSGVDMDYDGVHTYGDIFLRNEVEQCIYNLRTGRCPRLHGLYDAYEARRGRALT